MSSDPLEDAPEERPASPKRIQMVFLGVGIGASWIAVHMSRRERTDDRGSLIGAARTEARHASIPVRRLTRGPLESK